jgi:hypothetical protein
MAAHEIMVSGCVFVRFDEVDTQVFSCCTNSYVQASLEG